MASADRTSRPVGRGLRLIGRHIRPAPAINSVPGSGPLAGFSGVESGFGKLSEMSDKPLTVDFPMARLPA